MSKFKNYLVGILGEESYWKSTVLNSYGYQVIQRISQRFPDEIKATFDKLPLIPYLAINGVVEQIRLMDIGDGNHIGGSYFSFISTLKEEIFLTTTDAAIKYKNELAFLENLLQQNNQNEIERSKDQVIEIYRNFMMKQSSYADAQYEGKVLADSLGIHVIISSIGEENHYTQVYGPEPSNEVPTIVLHHTQGDRGAHFVLHKVNEDIIPHSIFGDGDCLFASFAQAILELYIQNSGFDTNATKAQRKVSQKDYGIKFGLIPRASIIEGLKDSNDLVRQNTCENLKYSKGPLSEEELFIVRSLAKYDPYQTVKIAAAELLYLRREESERPEYQNIIEQALSYPGLGNSYQDGADLVRARAAEAIVFLEREAGINISNDIIILLGNLARYDAYQTVRIEAAKALFFKGTEENARESLDIISQLINYNAHNYQNDLIPIRAMEAIITLRDQRPSTLELLKQIEAGPNNNLKANATIILSQLGQIKRPWQVAINKETKSKWATNGEVMLAVEYHPYELIKRIATHYCLLKYQDNPHINFIPFVQKFIAAGTKEKPNEGSVAFLQALKYSWFRYYGLPLSNDEEEFVATLFSLTDSTTPTLSLFNMLLSDFISKEPQGIWRSHKKDYTHFKEMVRCHKKVEESIKSETYSKQEKAINITMSTMIELLYVALYVFKDHELLKKVELSEEEKRFMKEVGPENPEAIKSIREAFLGEDERELLHVKQALIEEHKTLSNITHIRMIQTKVTLAPFLKSNTNNADEFFSGLDKHIQSIVDANKRYTKTEDIISFLVDLRDTILGKSNGIQLLGIGFHGSFFDAENNSFSDEAAVHLSFTEKYRIAGTVFLWFVCYELRKKLSIVFDSDIKVRVSSEADLSQKLMCQYTMDYIWTQIVQNPENVDDRLVNKLCTLINRNLKNIINSKAPKETQEVKQIAAYAGLETDNVVEQLQKLCTSIDLRHPIQSSGVESNNILKFGFYVLNQKMYSCVETQLIPILNSGWIFPIILNPINASHSLVSFKLLPLHFQGFEYVYNFFVAKPCEKFCQPASTAYDIIAEISSQFAETRGFVGTSFPTWERKNTLIEFSDIEFDIIKKILAEYGDCFDEHYMAYERMQKAQELEITSNITNTSNLVVPRTIDPTINNVVDKKTGKTKPHQAIEEKNLDKVKDLLDKGAELNLPAKSGYTPLHFSVYKGSLEITAELVNRGADITKVDNKGYTLLHLAANFGHIDIVRLLLERMPLSFVEAKDKTGKTAVAWAIKHQDIVTLIETTIKEKQVQELSLAHVPTQQSTPFEAFDTTTTISHDDQDIIGKSLDNDGPSL